MEYRKDGAMTGGLPAESDIPGCQEPDTFQDGKGLSLFLGKIIPITDKESDVLFGYMEGHGYALGCRDGKLYRGDLCCTAEEGLTWEEYTLNDVVKAVIEWNFQMIEQTADEEYEYIERLKADEKILDALDEKVRGIEGVGIQETGGGKGTYQN